MVNVKIGLHRPRCMSRLARLLPDNFWEHRRAARRERILSWRSLLDAAAARLEEPVPNGKVLATEMVPDSFWAHRQAAQEEDLLAVRSLIDAALNWWDAWSKEEPPTTDVVTRIEVE